MMPNNYKNIYGQALTRQGKLDQRQYNHPKQENDGKAYRYFTVVERPNDGRPWHVISITYADGVREIISRHTSQAVALKRAEKERLKQPNRKPSPKERHKLGI